MLVIFALASSPKAVVLSLSHQINFRIIESGVYFTPEGGSIENVQLVSLGGTKIEQAVDMELKFIAPHKVMGPSYILIKMPLPEKIEFTCNLAKTVGLKSAPTCVELGNNQLKLENPFNDNKYEGG